MPRITGLCVKESLRKIDADPATSLLTVLRDQRDLTSAGEAPIICLAPAVGNAVVDATGQRLRSLPMKLA